MMKFKVTSPGDKDRKTGSIHVNQRKKKGWELDIKKVVRKFLGHPGEGGESETPAREVMHSKHGSCPQCGTGLTAKGVCPACGHKTDK